MSENSCAIITGASRGIGREIARQLASQKNNIIICYNKSKKMAEDLAKELSQKYEIKAFPFKCNMENYEDIDNLLEFTMNHFKKIDILINNAGICMDCEFRDRTVVQFEKTFKINLFSVFYLSKIVGECMFRQKSGKIINISSNNSFNGLYPTTIDYDASKSALNSLTRNLAIQFAPYVNVNAIAPGWVDTEMNKDLLTPEIIDFECQRILKNRIGKPEDVANLVTFLVSDKADYINGEVVVIDGGMF